MNILEMKDFKKLAVRMLMCGAVFSLAACQPVSTVQVSHQVAKSAFQTEALKGHLQALETIAEQHGGNRAVGTAGGEASARYILNEAKKAGLTAQMLPFENREKTVGQNIIVEISGQSKDRAIIVGAHYDSVTTGPGINDNGSGVALLLELMRHYAAQGIQPKHSIYLAFWDSEEVGIAGSHAFVSKMSAEQLKGIQAYINVDMVGTRNPTIQIADGDQSSIDVMEKMLKAQGMAEKDYKPVTETLRQIPFHQGDLALEKHLNAFFKAKGMQTKEDVSILTASDTAPFLGKVPVASLVFLNEQMHGDVLEFAPCYHQACDKSDLVDPTSIQLAAEATLDLIAMIETQP